MKGSGDIYRKPTYKFLYLITIFILIIAISSSQNQNMTINKIIQSTSNASNIDIEKIEENKTPTVIMIQIPKEDMDEVEVIEEPTYTEDDLFCMAVVIYREAGSNWCSDEMQQLVGCVVLNRVTSDKFPNTIRKVLKQYKQFNCLWKYGIHFPKNTDKDAKDRAYKNAKLVLEGKVSCPENVVYQAECRQGSGLYKKVQNMYFCYL